MATDKNDKPIFTAAMIYALELVEIEEQLAALERTDQRLQAMAEQSSNNPDLERRRNEIIDKAAPLERRRQEIIAAEEAAAEIFIVRGESWPTPDLFGDIQPELDFLANAHSEAQKIEEDREEKRERSKLLPARYTNQDFFVADILGYSLKDDHATMEAPVFSLKTQKDLTPWEWTSKDGTKHIEVSPSVKYGRATQHDKDILIFVASQMTGCWMEK